MIDLPAPLDRTKVTWSYTFLHIYDAICPHQAYRRFIARNLPFTPQSQAQKHGIDGHKAMERRLGAKIPLPPTYQQYECFAQPFDGKNALVEQKLGITVEGRATGFFSPDTWGRGTGDVVLLNEMPKPTKAYLGDWKFGKSKYETPFELEIHAVLLHAKFSTLKSIKGQYIYLGENRPSQIYDLSHTSQTWKKSGRSCTKSSAIGRAGSSKSAKLRFADSVPCAIVNLIGWRNENWASS